MFESGSRLSDIPLRWMTQEAEKAGLLLRPRAALPEATDDDATGDPHRMSAVWHLLGTHRRQVPPGARVHASVARRIEVHPGYRTRIPEDVVYVDSDWQEPVELH